MTRNQLSPRFLLWVDAVGGFLVCLADEVVLGQALPDAHVEVPILGDLSRKHAKIRREDESYVLQPISPVVVEGRRIRDVTVLADGDEIELGESVTIRFRQPHALSSTARLEFISHHRTQPSSDAVLLMADSCVLGPGIQNHVVCRKWSGDVVLYRGDRDDFHCRADQDVEIDGKSYTKRGSVTRNSRVVGTDFALRLEAI